MSACIIRLGQCSDCLKMFKETKLCRLEDESWRNLCSECYVIWQRMEEWKQHENPKRI